MPRSPAGIRRFLGTLAYERAVGHLIGLQLLQRTVPVMPAQGMFCLPCHSVAMSCPGLGLAAARPLAWTLSLETNRANRGHIGRPWETGGKLRSWNGSYLPRGARSPNRAPGG